MNRNDKNNELGILELFVGVQIVKFVVPLLILVLIVILFLVLLISVIWAAFALFVDWWFAWCGIPIVIAAIAYYKNSIVDLVTGKLHGQKVIAGTRLTSKESEVSGRFSRTITAIAKGAKAARRGTREFIEGITSAYGNREVSDRPGSESKSKPKRGYAVTYIGDRIGSKTYASDRSSTVRSTPEKRWHLIIAMVIPAIVAVVMIGFGISGKAAVWEGTGFTRGSGTWVSPWNDDCGRPFWDENHEKFSCS